jgi:hypothetical protein
MLVLSFDGCALLKKRVRLREQRAQTSSAMEQFSREVFWVWERPEDLGGINPANIGVAVLEQTVRLGATATLLPRRQPVVLPAGARRIAVVRLEPDPAQAARSGSPALLDATVDALLQVAREPGIAALQIDFDATRSERGFYRRLLGQLRDRMPAALPLTITALASWCAQDDWIADLPVDEATPMFFRMEPDRRRLFSSSAPEFRIREPLCMRSVGVSTGEPWPPATAGKRIYIFPDHGWAHDLPLVQATQRQRADLQKFPEKLQ